jgi:gluconolactonase
MKLDRTVLTVILLGCTSPDKDGARDPMGDVDAASGGVRGSGPGAAGGGSSGGDPAGAIAGAGGGSAGGGAGAASDGGAPDLDSDAAPDALAPGVDGARPDAPAAIRPRCPAGPFAAPAAGAGETVCADFKFSYNYNEGPTWIASQGAFFFSNYQHYVGKGGDIIKYTPGGQCEFFIRDVGCNGLAATPDGNLVGACHQTRSVVRFDVTTKQATTLADGYMGMMFQTPNDLVVHSNGTVYFTNPPFELGGRPAGVTIPIFRIDPRGMVTPVAEGRPANGIGLAPDESRLYALQGGMFDLDPAGVPSNQRALFAGGDGLAVDCAGNLYASGTIYGPDGKHLGTYPSGTNLAFGGADGKTLIVVGGGTRVRTVPMTVPGLP